MVSSNVKRFLLLGPLLFWDGAGEAVGCDRLTA
jgi:hypothetical protein